VTHSQALAHSNLSLNALSGTIPDLSSLMRLTALDLYSNSLKGPIPASLSNLMNLDYLCVRARAVIDCGLHAFGITLAVILALTT
jgi:hypothetical protein